MGVGNLQQALMAYGKGVVPYAQLYFDSSPLRHAAAWRKLASLGDDSSTYLWRVLAAREIMRQYRADPDGARSARRCCSRTRPRPRRSCTRPRARRSSTTRSRSAARGRRASCAPSTATVLAPYGLRIDPQHGRARPRRIKQSPRLYRALRPQALAVLAGARRRDARDRAQPSR